MGLNLSPSRWLKGVIARTTMDDDSRAWYPFAITDASTPIIVENRGLPPECGGLVGKPVDIDTAVCALEATGVINPGLVSHNITRTTPSGPSP